MMQEKIEAAVRSRLSSDGYRFGFADLRGLLPPGFKRYPAGIAILRRLDPRAVDSAADGPSPAYYREYQDVNEELAAVSSGLATDIAALGVAALALSPTLHDAQLDANFSQTLRAPVSHKMLATRAGLGWIGKTDLLVSTDFGPRIRLASVLLGETPLSCPEPISESRCGSCDVCVRACPARAATGREWKAGLDRDEFFDAHKCRENCKMLSRLRLGEDVSLCGICVSLCPRGKNDRALTARTGHAYTASHA
jgi:epoxyqueuosine reductase